MSRNIKRIMLDYKEYLKDKDTLNGIHYIHDETNLFKGYAMIIGHKDTPYEYGYYFFEFNFPSNYPFSPPSVTFLTYDGHTRFNPNLYIEGKVCLSILNTWQGEQWSSCQSITSILITIQTMVLNDSPLLNEPNITKEHPDYNNYNLLIEYKNVEIAILKYLEKTNLPYEFHSFYPIMVESFKQNYNHIFEKFKNKKNKTMTMNLYSLSFVNLNYEKLLNLTDLVYKDIIQSEKNNQIKSDIST